MPISKDLIIRATTGLHFEPAADFVDLSEKFSGEVTVSFDGKEANGKSMLHILALGVTKDSTINLTLDGEDQEEYMLKFEEFASTKYE
tara:strand:- start:169 stop:432 length:264 start_codon:yes stop_codon:yes gene_type:complete